MNNSERLLLYTLPRWAGVTVQSIDELLSDFWIRGESAGHHAGLQFDPDGIDELRREIRKDFEKAPSAGSFKAGAPIQNVQDLAIAMATIQQKPLPESSKMLAAFLPKAHIRRLQGA